MCHGGVCARTYDHQCKHLWNAGMLYFDTFNFQNLCISGNITQSLLQGMTILYIQATAEGYYLVQYSTILV